MHTTLSARLSQPQPEGGALAAVLLRLYSREFSEKPIPTSRWVAERRERFSLVLHSFALKSSELSPKDLSTLDRKSFRLVRVLMNDW